MQQLKYHYHPIAGLHPVCVHYHSHFAGHYLCLGIGLLYIHICLWHQVLSFYEYIGGCHCHRLVTTFRLTISVSNVVELPGAGLGRRITINSELNGATQTSEAATEAGRASQNLGSILVNKVFLKLKFSKNIIVYVYTCICSS